MGAPVPAGPWPLVRLSCPACGYEAGVIMWCHDPACCAQDPAAFLGFLAALAAARPFPVFAIRRDPPALTQVYRPGCPAPVFAGLSLTVTAFLMDHPCPP